MRTRLFLTALLFVLTPRGSWAELHFGYGDTLIYGIDFSTGLIGYGITEEALDFSLYDVAPGPEVGVDYVNVVALRGSLDMGEIGLSAITVAPDTSEVNYTPKGLENVRIWPILSEGHSYVVRTREDHFAKFFVSRFRLNSFPIKIDWVYQDDGSRNFESITLVGPHAWGEVKKGSKRSLPWESR